jgi:hypothetical protein
MQCKRRKEEQTMDTHRRRWSLERVVLVGAIALGLAAGSYGIANAATGSGSSNASSDLSASALLAASAAPSAQHPWGGRRPDETLLTGTAATKVEQLALDKVPGATVVRVETDADGNAAYEAHMVKSDGTPVTVYVSKDFQVVSVQSGMPGQPSASG